jgi:hypothetical protein
VPAHRAPRCEAIRACAASTASALSRRVADSASSDPKTDEPATIQSAPAVTIVAMFCSSMPPSTSMGADDPARSSRLRIALIFDVLRSMNA